MRKLLLLTILAMCVLTSGCYINKDVGQHQVGVQMADGVSISKIVAPGRYSDWGWFADMQRVDVSAKTLIWDDPDLVTRDKQPIGFSVAVTYARERDSESVESMWTDYYAEAINDEALDNLVRSRIPRVAKAVTTKYTLDEMLADRHQIQSDLNELLSEELADANIRLLDVGINNIAPSEKYLEALEDKAAAQIAVEVAREKTKELEEKLNQEKAQTEIELERARRQNEVNEELAKTYAISSQVYELERLRLLRDVIGDNDKLVIVPDGAGLNLFLTQGVVEDVVTPPVAPIVEGTAP